MAAQKCKKMLQGSIKEFNTSLQQCRTVFNTYDWKMAEIS